MLCHPTAGVSCMYVRMLTVRVYVRVCRLIIVMGYGGVRFVRALCGTQSMPHSHYWEITQNFNILIITSTSTTNTTTTTAVVAMVTMCVRIGSCTRRGAVIQQRTYNCEFHFHCCVMIHGPMLHTYLLSVLHWSSHSSTLLDQNRPHCFCSPRELCICLNLSPYYNWTYL